MFWWVMLIYLFLGEGLLLGQHLSGLPVGYIEEEGFSSRYAVTGFPVGYRVRLITSWLYS